MESEVVSSFFTDGADVTLTNDANNSEILEPKSRGNEEICDKFLHLIDELNISLERFPYPSNIESIYNPTIYARHTFEMYVRKYCNTRKSIMYFGMNPGPWGMSQTGVPFGEISSVRDWLGIQGPVGKPPTEISTRPIKGFECSRTEVSQMEKLFDICDPFFIKVVELYEVKTVVAVGKFCETRAQKAIQKYFSAEYPIKVLYLPHPSPRTVNNNNWDQKALEHLKNLNLLQYYEKT